MRFHLPTLIRFGSGVFAGLKEIMEKDLGVSRAFLVTDKGIRKTGLVERVLDILPEIEVFEKTEPNPRHSTVNKAGCIVRSLSPEIIIGLGGGSVLDAAKAVALLGTNPGKIEDYEGRSKYKSPPLPVLAIPTTCGTGSEVTWVSVITHTERKFKMSIKGPEMFPAAALVDPDMLTSLPPVLVASTGMDAIVHAIEAYTVKPATFITDIFALEAAQILFSFLEAGYKDIKNNHSAREGLMKGSMLAGIAFGNSDVGAVHCISESIGALFDVPHGVANSIFLPYVMEFNLPVSAARYAEIARMIGIDKKNDNEAGLGLIKKIKDLSRVLNIPVFKDLGIEESYFQDIAQKSFQNNSNSSNPRKAGIEDYMGILRQAYNLNYS